MGSIVLSHEVVVSGTAAAARKALASFKKFRRVRPVICFPLCGFLSETSRMVAIYQKLVDFGIPAKIVTHGGTYEFVLENENLPYDKIEPALSSDDCMHYLDVMDKPWIDLYDKSTLSKMVTS